MTDDDELRDDFGSELSAALSRRSRGATVADVEVTVERGARRQRARRRILAATVAAAVVIAGVAVVATRSHGAKRLTVATPTTSTTTIPVSPGHRLVALSGVHVEVPAAWPIVDGMHTGFCGGTFPATPTAFVGPQQNFAPSCPYFKVPRRDGAWLYPGARPPDGNSVTTPSGVVVVQEDAGENDPVMLLWFHGDYIEIGLGRDPRISAAIFASIGYGSSVPDTPGAGACGRSDDASVMPTPERLTHELVLDAGNDTLRPPAPTDQATVPAGSVWNRASAQNFERYRVILARLSEKLPATQGPNGSLTPQTSNVLAWVVYAVPISPIEGCGMYIIDATNALTGQGIDESLYAPGP